MISISVAQFSHSGSAFLDLLSLLLTWFRRGGAPPSADHEQRGLGGIATDQWGQTEVTDLHPTGYKVIT